MSKRVIVSLFAVLFVAAFATFASAQETTVVASDPAVVTVAPCNPCAAPCVAPCCVPCRPPRVVVDPCTSVVYRRGLLGCYRPVCAPIAVCEPCCPPAPRFYRPYRAVGCCW